MSDNENYSENEEDSAIAHQLIFEEVQLSEEEGPIKMQELDSTKQRQPERRKRKTQRNQQSKRIIQNHSSDEQILVKKETKKRRAAPPQLPASSSYSSSESGSKKVEEDKAAPANKTTESKKLYVGNLSPEIKESILWTTFEKYGTILELHLILNKTTGKSKGFGFVEFLEYESAIQAKQELNLQVWAGKKIRIQYCTND